MAEQRVLDAFMDAYVLLSPQASELQELRAAGVGNGRILVLYPLQVNQIASWLLDVVEEEEGARRHFSRELVGRSRTTTVHRRAEFESGPQAMSKDHQLDFFKAGYDALVNSDAARTWTAKKNVNDAQANSWAQRITAELLWMGSNWNELSELHEWEQAHVEDLRLLAALLGKARSGQAVKVL